MIRPSRGTAMRQLIDTNGRRKLTRSRGVCHSRYLLHIGSVWIDDNIRTGCNGSTESNLIASDPVLCGDAHLGTGMIMYEHVYTHAEMTGLRSLKRCADCTAIK
jgi:hypothetical protein